MATAPHHPEIWRVRKQQRAQRGLRELAVVASDHHVGLWTDREIPDLRRVADDDALVRIRTIVRGTVRDETQMKAEHLPDREERAADGTATDDEELGPPDGAGDDLARRKGPHLDPDAGRIVPVIGPLEADLLAKRARRVGSAGSIESVAAERPETRAALEEDPFGHARGLERADAHTEDDLRGGGDVVDLARAQLGQRAAEPRHDLALDDAAARCAELGHQHAADHVPGALGVASPERDLLVDARSPQLAGIGARAQRILERRALEAPAASVAAHQHRTLAVLDDRACLLAGRTERQDRFGLFRSQRHPQRL